MKYDPDMGTQSGEERIDELLNGYIDDELGVRQRTEVERLIAHDPGIERRLQQLSRCRALLGALPCAEAPPRVLEAVKATLASTAAIYEQSSYGKRMGRIQLMARKMLSAAAMLALVGVLAGVIYTIMSPPAAPEEPASPSAERLAFNARLELTTSKLREVGAVVSAAITENGLSDSVGDVREPTMRIHYVKCTREGLDSLLTSLEYVWPKFDSATMVINAEVVEDQVSVDAVTAGQIAEIVDQRSHDARIALANEFAKLNSTAARGTEGTMRAAADGKAPGLPPIPKPILTSPPGAVKTPESPETDKTIRLTIVLSN